MSIYDKELITLLKSFLNANTINEILNSGEGVDVLDEIVYHLKYSIFESDLSFNKSIGFIKENIKDLDLRLIYDESRSNTNSKYNRT
jgi:hypothetical protein